MNRKEALMVISDRYSESQLLKVQDIASDLSDQLKEIGENEQAKQCDGIFRLISEIVNLTA